MVLQSSGVISFGNIQTEFGGVNPIDLSEYYQNNANGYTSGVSGIPNTGSTLTVSQFYGKAKVVSSGPPAPVQTVFTGTYAWVGGGSTYYEWLTGCAGTNSSRTGVSTFNNIGTQGQNRAGAIYYPELILQARAGDTIVFTINMNTLYGDYEHIRGWVNLGAGYFQIGEIWVNGSYQFAISYTIPVGTPAGNYALSALNDYGYGDGSYRSVNYYSLHVY